MDPVTKVMLWLIASLIVVVCVWVMTYRSSLSKDRKMAVYVVTFFVPVVGVLMYVYFRRYQAKHAGTA